MEKIYIEIFKIATENLPAASVVTLALLSIPLALLWHIVRSNQLAISNAKELERMRLRQEKLLLVCEKRNNKDVALYLTKDKIKLDDYPATLNKSDK